MYQAVDAACTNCKRVHMRVCTCLQLSAFRREQRTSSFCFFVSESQIHFYCSPPELHPSERLIYYWYISQKSKSWSDWVTHFNIFISTCRVMWLFLETLNIGCINSICRNKPKDCFKELGSIEMKKILFVFLIVPEKKEKCRIDPGKKKSLSWLLRQNSKQVTMHCVKWVKLHVSLESPRDSLNFFSSIILGWIRRLWDLELHCGL